MGASSSHLEDATPLPMSVEGKTTNMSSEPGFDLEQETYAKTKKLSDGKHSLCKRCRKLKLCEFSSSDGLVRHDLGFPTSWDSSECSLCRFFWDLTIESSLGHQAASVFFQSDIVITERNATDQSPEPNRRVGYLSVFKKSTHGWWCTKKSLTFVIPRWNYLAMNTTHLLTSFQTTKHFRRLFH